MAVLATRQVRAPCFRGWRKLSADHVGCEKGVGPMATPDYQTLMLPMLQLTVDGQEHDLREAIDKLGTEQILSTSLPDQLRSAVRGGRLPPSLLAM